MLTVLLSSGAFNLSARAFEAENVNGYTPNWSLTARPRLRLIARDGSRIQKFNLALDTLGIPREAAPDYSALPEDNVVLQADLTQNLKYIDPDGGLLRYLSLSPGKLAAFQDFFSALLPASMQEYSLNLSQSGTSSDSSDLITHLSTVGDQVKDPSNSQPLTGLKFVIDPGHMGTDFWDQAGGKFVTVGGKKVSEGKINLWTSYLVANTLEDLGATVVLTRTQDGPVSQLNYQNYPMAAYINQYFYQSMDDWMAPYLSLTDSTLVSTIKLKPEVKRAFSPGERENLFINGEDLEARSQIIDREKPDVVIDIHFDANLTTALQNSTNSLEVFVPGGFGANETGSRLNRRHALKQLTEVRRFGASVDLASEIVNAMSTSEVVPLQNSSSFGSSVKVKDGVYSRNLYITRRNLSALMVYLECLHYDHTSEFYNLANNNEVGTYHGVNFAYPTRLNSVAAGIRQGILNYFKNH
jgi:N-acetylmuramoyl-L-alanine amidase